MHINFIGIILLQGIILKENGKVGDAEKMFIQVSGEYMNIYWHMHEYGNVRAHMYVCIYNSVFGNTYMYIYVSIYIKHKYKYNHVFMNVSMFIWALFYLNRTSNTSKLQ